MVFEICEGFLSHRGTPSHHPFENGIVHSKPSLLGYPYFREPPHNMLKGQTILLSPPAKKNPGIEDSEVATLWPQGAVVDVHGSITSVSVL